VLHRTYAADEIDQGAEENTGGQGEAKCERQQKATGDAAIEPPNEQAAHRGVRPDGLPENTGRLERRTRGSDRRAPVPLRREHGRDETGERDEQIDEKRYANPFCYLSRLTTAVISVSRRHKHQTPLIGDRG
jgi:hypothetical protein